MAPERFLPDRLSSWFVFASLKTVLLLAALAGWNRCPAGEKWHEETGFRWADLQVPSGGKTGFRLLTPDETGIYFTNTLDQRTGEANRVLFNGSGVAVGDIDNDGLPDLFFCSLNGNNALYKNLGGFKFKDVTQGSGIACSNRFCRGAVFADINGDGFLDLLVATTGGGVLCFVNDGHGHFSDMTREAGTESRYGSETLALADVDGNGTLDLYVANNRTDDIRDRGQVDLQMVNGKPAVPPALADRLMVTNGALFEYGEPDVLYLNDGHGHFSPVSWTGGAFLDEDGKPLTGAPLDWGLTASFRDLNGDGWPDLYVCNDYWTPDRIWINDGHGRFHAAGRLAFRHTSASSMGIDFADVNRSGHLDFVVVDMLSRDLRMRKRQMFAQTPTSSPLGAIDNRPQIMRNTFFQNRGDGTFAEIADYAGISASEWSWSAVFLDVDLDGYEDLLIPAGHTRDVQDSDAGEQIRANSKLQKQIGRIADPKAQVEAFIQNKIENSHFYPPLSMPIVAYHNLGQYRFEETTSKWGTGQIGVHHALATGDFDGDGDLDLVVNNLGSAAGIYRNETSAPRIAVRLKGLSPNTQGIGANIKLFGGAVPMQSTEAVAGGRYMAGSETLAVFAAGNVTEGMSLEVKWRNGRLSLVKGVKANRIYEVLESGAEAAAAQPKPAPKPMFEDVSGLIAHTHHEEWFNDFERQPLLPRKLSQLGPGIAWADLDGDGWEDLVIGSGKGGRLAIYRNTHGAFDRLTGGALDKVSEQDQAGIAVLIGAGDSRCVLVGSTNYKEGPTAPGGVACFDAKTQQFAQPLTLGESSAGPLALADMDGDGELELFVGGRVIGGRYPEPASSRIFRHRSGQWQLDATNSHVLEKIGLVSSAVWSDLDGDGYPELILACEWGPIHIFHNNHGQLSEWAAPVHHSAPNPQLSTAPSAVNSQPLTLNQLSGWWNGVTTGDVDGSGRMSIIAGNWGLNTPYQASLEHPALLYYGDFAGLGAVDLIEAQYDPALKAYAPRRMRNLVATALPDLMARFPIQRSFSEATAAEVLGERQGVRQETATYLQSAVFLNRGDRFEIRPLPAEAQFAPAFSVNVADFDGDGFEDVFLSQNFFDNQPEVPRYDAGRGLLLKGDGNGNFTAVPGQESGILVYGEQRGAAVADFDHDGRVDLAVSQNAATTRLFRNVAAKPGIRVRLVGPPGNPTGIGAQVRLIFGSRPGPVREIHAGSGYWSQDASIVVLSTPQAPSAIWVRWPGGKVNQSQITGQPKQIAVNYDGKIEP